MTDNEKEVARARALWDGFYYCPTSSRVLEALKGDDKVLCRCGKSNPKAPEEHTEQTGVHIRRFLRPATAEAFVAQENARRG